MAERVVVFGEVVYDGRGLARLARLPLGRAVGVEAAGPELEGDFGEDRVEILVGEQVHAERVGRVVADGRDGQRELRLGDVGVNLRDLHLAGGRPGRQAVAARDGEGGLQQTGLGDDVLEDFIEPVPVEELDQQFGDPAGQLDDFDRLDAVGDAQASEDFVPVFVDQLVRELDQLVPVLAGVEGVERRQRGVPAVGVERGETGRRDHGRHGVKFPGALLQRFLIDDCHGFVDSGLSPQLSRLSRRCAGT